MGKPNLTIWAVRVATFLCILVMASAAPAAKLTFQDIGVQGGTLSYDGNGGSLIGVDIKFDTILSSDTAAHSGTELACLGCLFNFTTGSNISESPSYSWGSGFYEVGGTFTLTGEVDFHDSNYENIGPDSVILAGQWLTEISGTVSGNEGNFKITIAGMGYDYKNELLLDYYQLDAVAFILNTTEISTANTVFDDYGGFSTTVSNAMIANTSTAADAAAPVPEPASFLLLGSGLLGLAAWRRYRKD